MFEVRVCACCLLIQAQRLVCGAFVRSLDCVKTLLYRLSSSKVNGSTTRLGSDNRIPCVLFRTVVTIGSTFEFDVMNGSHASTPVVSLDGVDSRQRIVDQRCALEAPSHPLYHDTCAPESLHDFVPEHEVRS